MCDEPSLGLAPAITQELFALLARLNKERGMAMLLVEQNARLTLKIAHRAYVIESGEIRLRRGASCATIADPARQSRMIPKARRYLRDHALGLMQLFLQQIVEGLASGAIYASLALALVLIYRATRIVNFAQGEMATLSAYLAWQLTQWGVPFVAQPGRSSRR